MIDYSLGYQAAMLTVAAFIFIMVIFAIGVVRLTVKKSGIRKAALVCFLAIVMLPVSVCLVLFPPIFSVVNLLHLDFMQVDFWKLELSNGVFAVRIISCVLAWKFISTLIALVKKNNIFEKKLEKDQLDETRALNDIATLSKEQAKLLLTKDLTFLSLLQFSFYLACVSSLWFSTISMETNIVVALTSWGLFYIVDDWSVMSEYSQKFEVLPMSTHWKKINIFNCALFVGSSISLLLTDNWGQAIVILMTLIFIGTALGMYYWRASKVIEKFT